MPALPQTVAFSFSGKQSLLPRWGQNRGKVSKLKLDSICTWRPKTGFLTKQKVQLPCSGFLGKPLGEKTPEVTISLHSRVVSSRICLGLEPPPLHNRRGRADRLQQETRATCCASMQLLQSKDSRMSSSSRNFSSPEKLYFNRSR